MTNNKRFRPTHVIAGLVCIGFALWFLILALIVESTPAEVRAWCLIGAAVHLWAAVQGLNKK